MWGTACWGRSLELGRAKAGLLLPGPGSDPECVWQDNCRASLCDKLWPCQWFWLEIIAKQ